MEREHPLFEKSYDELRETFVRARFGEPNIFGRPDIEEWLRDARPYVGDPLCSTDEWEAKGLREYLIREWNGYNDYRLVGILCTHASPLDKPPRGFLENVSYRNSFLNLLNALQQGGAKVYYKSRKTVSFPAVIIGNMVYVAEFKGPNHILALRKATIEDIKHVIFAEVAHDRRKRELALAWLKNEYAHAISQTSHEASRDFDEAVAVSADGTKITKACEVVVILDEHRIVIYPAESFLKDKILRSENLARFGPHRPDTQMQTEEVYRDWVLKSTTMLDLLKRGQGQILDLCTYYDRKMRLVTETRYCPSPLPDGGREIRRI